MTKQRLSLVAVGDMLPTRPLFSGDRPASDSFANTLELVHAADIAFGNFEIPLSNRGYPREKLITFRADPEVAPDVGKLGFDVLSLANNHILDYGYEALFDTIHLLRGQGIRLIGAGSNLAEASAPVVLEANGWRVGFIAFTSLLPTGAAAAPERPGLSPIHVHSAYEINCYWQMEEPGEPMIVTPRTWADDADVSYAAGCIAGLRDECDFTCVSMHWGFGASEELATYQRPLGHALIEAGADVVFGNHPHAVHAVELYRDKAIFFSPSTFIGQQVREDASPIALAIWAAMSPDGYVMHLDIEPDGSYRTRIIPVSLDTDGLAAIARGEVFDRIADRLVRLSAQLGTRVEVVGDELLLAAPRPAGVK